MRIRTLMMAVATVAALLLAPIASSRAESPVFAGTKHTVLDTKSMQKVTAQGSTSALYGYYGLLYGSYATQYGAIAQYYNYYGYSSTSKSYFYSAYYYAYYSYLYYYNAYYYS